MTPRRLLILGAAAVVVLVGALLLSNPRSSADQKPAGALYPDLKEQVNAVTAVRIFKAGDTQAVEVQRKDAEWNVTERSGYPADVAQVRKLLLALAQAKPVEEKTSNPENYATLGVEDVSDAKATGVRIELAGTPTPVNLIVGKSGGGANSTYVRRVGEPASWLVDQNLETSPNPHDWLRSSIIDIGADRVQSATITLGNAKPYSAAKKTRADADFAVDGLPKGKQLSSPSVANSFATALSALTLAEVRPVSDFTADKPIAHATYRTFDGLVAEVDGWMKDSKHYVAIKTSYDAALAQRFHLETKAPDKTADAATEKAATKPAGAASVDATKPAATQPTDAAKQNENIEDAARTNAALAGWVYEIPEYKYEAIFKPLDSLLKK